MIFSDSFFIFIFLPLFLSVFYLHEKLQKLSLFLFSLIFYLAFDTQVLTHFLLPFLILNFLYYRLNTPKGVSVLFNVFFLIFFKYQTIVIDLVPVKLFLFETAAAPMGLSFITLQMISFVIDYKREDKKVNILDYLNYFTFFPQMIAGPICRKSDLLSQITSVGEKFKFNSFNFFRGILIFTIGAIKKVVIADNIGKYIDPFFLSPESSELSAIVSTVGYSLQLYFDFSAYADMAIGIALLINIQLPENFTDPLKSESIAEFWRRWHITLHTFFKNYMYKPFLGSNLTSHISIGKRKTIVLFMIFLLSGAWHGNGANYILFGAIHAMYIIIGKIINLKTGFRIVNRLVVFILCYFSFIVFRCFTFSDTVKVFKLVFSVESIPKISNDINFFIFLMVLVFYKIICPYSREYLEFFTKVIMKNKLVYTSSYFLVLIFLPILYLFLFYVGAGSGKPFIYFAF